MPHQAVGQLTLSGIAHRCEEETQRFFQRLAHDPRYCFELFRRAIVERCQAAWALVYDQYRPLVAGWVERHAAFPGSGEEVQYFVNRAFEKMWAALTPAKFQRFPDLKYLLRYLQTCVHSAVLDVVRKADQHVVDVPLDLLPLDAGDDDPSVEWQALDRVQQGELWQQIDARLQDDKERRVVYGSFVLALKPREIYARGRGVFRDVAEIYRIKENVLARLRRDAGLRELLGYDA